MELLNILFRLGVVFAIYGFIWFFIDLGFSLIRGGRRTAITEIYLIKGAKYILLSIVAFMFTLSSDFELDNYHYALTGLILLLYFLGKLHRTQNRQVFVQLLGNRVNPAAQFNLVGEIVVIALAVCMYIFLLYYPEFAFNGVSIWFKESILSIEKTPLFGWVFKLIGFFFVVSSLMKVINGFFVLLSGKALVQSRSVFSKKEKDGDEFDEYEEMN